MCRQRITPFPGKMSGGRRRGPGTTPTAPGASAVQALDSTDVSRFPHLALALPSSSSEMMRFEREPEGSRRVRGSEPLTPDVNQAPSREGWEKR